MRRFRELRPCWMCRADFTATQQDMVFCAPSCGDAWRAEARASSDASAPRPAGAPPARTATARRVTRRLDPQGYVMVGQQYEHRLVAAVKLGRPLRRGEDVHHLNGDRADNRPSNLHVMPHGAHARMHWIERRGYALDEPNRNGTATSAEWTPETTNAPREGGAFVTHSGVSTYTTSGEPC